MKDLDVVWVKAQIRKQDGLPEQVVILDKNDQPIYYTTVGSDQVQVKE